MDKELRASVEQDIENFKTLINSEEELPPDAHAELYHSTLFLAGIGVNMLQSILKIHDDRHTIIIDGDDFGDWALMSKETAMELIECKKTIAAMANFAEINSKPTIH